MIKVGIAGAGGKMGRALVRAVVEHPELQLASAWEAPGNALLGQDAGQLAGLEKAGVTVLGSAAEALALCDLAIDFTAPEATVALVGLAEKAGKPLVIGTTGLTPVQLEQLQSAGRKIGMVYATNYSAGVNLLWALARKAAAVLGDQFDAEIVEFHHNMKKDSPSGTANTLLEAVCQGKGLDPVKAVRHGRDGMVGARTRDEVGMHAVRGGDIVGDHIVLFAGPGERLEIKHQMHSRDTLARGAVRAAAWLSRQKPGFYHVSDVLGLSTL
jgi:4-hydroxy-tetrahydrodipicolinate reductase